MSTRSRSAALAGLGTAAALLLAGCGTGAAPATGPAPGTVAVVASTNVYGSIAAAVGGANVHVNALIDDPSADPHTFEATPADAAEIADARIVVVNGGGYDDFAGKLLDAAGDRQRTVIDVAALSGLQPGSNEHLWYRLPTVEQLVEQLATELAAADPAHTDDYRAGADAFVRRLGELQRRTDAIRQGHVGERVAVTEPVPGYLIEAAGLTDATPPAYAEAIEEDADPPAAVLQQTLDLFTGAPVRALVLNAQTRTPTTDQVQRAAQTAGVPVVDVTETLPTGQYDYLTWMGGQIDALAAALNR